MTIQRLTRITALCLCLFIGLVSTTMLSRSSAQSARPVEMDVRGVAGVPKGTALRAPVLSQVKALTALQATVRDTIQVRYRAGQIISVGGESFPQLRITNAATLTPEQAITNLSPAGCPLASANTIDTPNPRASNPLTLSYDATHDAIDSDRRRAATSSRHA